MKTLMHLWIKLLKGLRRKKAPLFIRQIKIFPTPGLRCCWSREGWFLSYVMRMYGCGGWNSSWPRAIKVPPSLVLMPSWAVGVGDHCGRHLRDKVDVNRSWEEWGRRNKCPRYTQKSIKMPSPNIWPGNWYFIVLPEKVSVCNLPSVSTAAAMEQRGEKKNLAKETRWEETGEKEETLNCALDHLPLMDTPSHPLPVKQVSLGTVCGWICSDV